MELIQINEDVRKLFETKTIEEIQSIAAQTSHEIGKKRQELRTMVGERYLDLIEAAEAIMSMKVNSENFLKAINSFSLDVQFGSQNQVHTSFTNRGLLEITAQIKLLKDIPELIWNCLDEDKYVEGTSLYLLARHVHINLLCSEDKYLSRFPVIHRTWEESTVHLEHVIRSSLEKALSETKLNLNETLQNLSSFLYLTPVGELFENFLQLRISCITRHINETIIPAKIYTNNIIEALLSSLNIFYHAFHSDSLQDFLILQKNNSEPALSYFNTKSSRLFNHLPSVISEFRVSCTNFSMDVKIIENSVSLFLSQVQTNIVNQMSEHVLLHVTSIRNLSSIRSMSCSLLTSVSDWSLVSEKLLGRHLDVWKEFFESVYEKQIDYIISSVLEKATSELVSEIPSLEGKDDLFSSENGETNFLYFSDFLRLLASRLKSFDALLSNLIDDVSTYYSSSRDSHLSLILTESLSQKMKTTRFDSGNSAYFLGRMWQSLPEHCPSFLKAVSPSESCILNSLESKALESYSFWKESLCETLKKDLEDFLGREKGDKKGDYLSLFPSWNSFAISEENENGDFVSSSISVPQFPSIPFLAALLTYVESIGKCEPESLPSRIIESLRQDAGSLIMNTYYNTLKEKNLLQNEALQLSFDVQFVSLIMDTGIREDLIQLLETFIDPFDLNVFSKYIGTNVKKAVAQQSILLGCLISSERLSLLASFQFSALEEEDVVSSSPNILLTSKTFVPKNKFPLFPIATAESSVCRIGVKREEQRLVRKTIRDKSPKNQSGGFFGSMSSAIFGVGGK